MRKYPSRYKVVQYETLIVQPEIFLRELCHFIGEDYAPEMLMVEPAGQSESSQDPTTVRMPREIWSTSIGRFRQTLSEREVAFIKMVTRDRMIHYGYSL